MGDMGLTQALWDYIVFMMYLIVVTGGMALVAFFISLMVLIVAVTGISLHDLAEKRKKRRG